MRYQSSCWAARLAVPGEGAAVSERLFRVPSLQSVFFQREKVCVRVEELDRQCCENVEHRWEALLVNRLLVVRRFIVETSLVTLSSSLRVVVSQQKIGPSVSVVRFLRCWIPSEPATIFVGTFISILSPFHHRNSA